MLQSEPSLASFVKSSKKEGVTRKKKKPLPTACDWMTLGDWQWLTVGWTLGCKFQLQQNELKCAACLDWLNEHKRVHFRLIFTGPLPAQCWKVTAFCCSAVAHRLQVMLYPNSPTALTIPDFCWNSKISSTAAEMCQDIRNMSMLTREKWAAVESKTSWMADAAGPHPWSTHKTEPATTESKAHLDWVINSI